MKLQRFLWLVITQVVCVYQHSLASKKNVKITDGVDFKLNDGGFSDTDTDSVADPDPVYGPESLYFLNGHCFSKTSGRFDYTICPFQNVTQRRSIGQRGSTLIGVWGDWLTTINSTFHPIHGEDFQLRHYNAMRFVDGKNCGDGRQHYSSVLNFKCDYEKEDFDVLGVEEDESNSCNFVITLGVPLACSLFQNHV